MSGESDLSMIGCQDYPQLLVSHWYTLILRQISGKPYQIKATLQHQISYQSVSPLAMLGDVQSMIMPDHQSPNSFIKSQFVLQTFVVSTVC